MSALRIVDTAPTFESFAKAAALESPHIREQMWLEMYERVHPDVFEAFYAGQERRRPLGQLRELPRVREHAREGSAALEAVIGEVEPAVRRVLEAPDDVRPVHVLLVGAGAVNATVGRLGDEVAVFHCLEWFRSADDWRVLAAHETAHAFHEIQLGGAGPEDDLSWIAFSEGLAVLASQAAVPDRPRPDYYWYGLPGFEGWLEWCTENRDSLRAHLAEHIDDAAVAGSLFGADLHEGHLRTGYHTAADLLGGLGRPLPELARLGVDEARELVRSALRG